MEQALRLHHQAAPFFFFVLTSVATEIKDNGLLEEIHISALTSVGQLNVSCARTNIFACGLSSANAEVTRTTRLKENFHQSRTTSVSDVQLGITPDNLCRYKTMAFSVATRATRRRSLSLLEMDTVELR